jgi:ubiquinone/menaquinone biosynthesis C-methylase UbiE
MAEAANLFDNGPAYERRIGRWSSVVAATFLDWLDVPKNLRWLDVGCGTGAFTEALIARCSPAAVTAIDPSQQQLDYARTRPGATLAHFQTGAAQALAFPDRSFDAAAMALVIVFVPDPPRAVAEMVRVVRPGGLVAAYMWDMPGGGFPLQPLGTAMKSLGMALPPNSGFEFSRQDKMREIWEHAGLQSIETRAIRIPVVYTGFDELWESSSMPTGFTGKAIQEMSPSRREELKARLREQLPTRSDGCIAYEAFANAVKGRTPG